MAVVADVFDVVLIDGDNDVIGTTTLQEANIEVTVKESDIRGGKGNQLLGVLHSDRDIKLNLTDVNFRYDWMAKQLGQPVVTGAGVAYAMPAWYEVMAESTDNIVTLATAPTSIDSISLYDSNGVKLVKTTDYTLTTNAITILKAGISAGDKVEVRTYAYASETTTETIEIDNSVFAKGVKVVLETVEIDESTETATHKLQWQFDNSLPVGTFTISTKSAKEASAQSFNLRVVKPKTSTVVGRSLRIPLS